MWDGSEYSLGITMGSNFADGRGNATLFFGYTNTDALLQSERDYSACAISTSGLYCGGSSTSYPGRFRVANLNGIGTYSRTIDAETGQIRPFAGVGPLQLRPAELLPASAGALSGRSVRPLRHHATRRRCTPSSCSWTTARWRRSRRRASFGTVISTIQCSNPLLLQNGGQWFNELCTSAGIPLTGSRDVTIQRRNVEGGGRQDDLGLTSYRGVVGIKGSFLDGNWNYDVSGQYGTVLFSETYQNDFSIAAHQTARSTWSPTANGPACRSVVDGTDPTCVPWNIWSIGGVTPEALDYVATPGFQRGDTTQTVVTASLSSDLGNYGIKLPTAKDGIGIAFGAEYREEGLNFETDTAFTTGDLAGQGGPTIGVSGGYNVTDLFAEARIPLLQDIFLAQDLTMTASYRYSDYSLDETTRYLWYRPRLVDRRRRQAPRQLPARRARAERDRAVLGGVAGPVRHDPRSLQHDRTRRATLAAVPEHRPADGVYGSDLDSSAGQYNAIFGGNTDLKPESADTWTAGIVFTPTFIDGLAVTIDYWNIKVEDTIGTVPPATALDQCLADRLRRVLQPDHARQPGDAVAAERGADRRDQRQHRRDEDLGLGYRVELRTAHE